MKIIWHIFKVNSHAPLGAQQYMKKSRHFFKINHHDPSGHNNTGKYSYIFSRYTLRPGFSQWFSPNKIRKNAAYLIRLITVTHRDIPEYIN